MILTDREIKIAVERGLIVIDPIPENDAFSSTSVDLTLDQNITEFNSAPNGLNITIDPTHKGYDFERVFTELSNTIDINQEQGYLLEPEKLVLGWSKEYINLKITSRLAARVEGKSSLARWGIGVHLTAPTIHAGFEGQIRLEMINHGPVPILLRPEMRVCQLVLETTLGTPERGYSGQFSGQTS